MSNIKIYIATHKKVDFPKNEIYCPIQVGAYNKEKFTEVTDDIGDNISNKNSNYCELTAAYWITKNDKSDIKGLVHYRRYFFKSINNNLDEILAKKDIEKVLEDYDIIVPRKTCLLQYKNLKTAYYKVHSGEDFEKCKNIIKEKYNDYLEAFEWMEKQRSFYACNMFISKKEIFEEYHKWLFEILFELEKQVDISEYTDYNKRIFGFLSERLFNVWVYKNKLKVKEIQVYNTEGNAKIQYLIDLGKKIIFDRKNI